MASSSVAQIKLSRMYTDASPLLLWVCQALRLDAESKRYVETSALAGLGLQMV